MPVPPDRVRPIVLEVLKKDTTRIIGRWPVMKESEIREILQQLAREDTTAGVPVYVSGGEVLSPGPAEALVRR